MHETSRSKRNLSWRSDGICGFHSVNQTRTDEQKLKWKTTYEDFMNNSKRPRWVTWAYESLGYARHMRELRWVTWTDLNESFEMDWVSQTAMQERGESFRRWQNLCHFLAGGYYCPASVHPPQPTRESEWLMLPGCVFPCRRMSRCALWLQGGRYDALHIFMVAVTWHGVLCDLLSGFMVAVTFSWWSSRRAVCIYSSVNMWIVSMQVWLAFPSVNICYQNRKNANAQVFQ